MRALYARAARRSLIPVLEKMRELYAEAKERAEKIKSGEYDFSLDGEDEGESEDSDIPTELLESEEDRLLDEKEAEEAKRADKLVTAVSSVIFAAALIFFLLKFIFKVF